MKLSAPQEQAIIAIGDEVGFTDKRTLKALTGKGILTEDGHLTGDGWNYYTQLAMEVVREVELIVLGSPVKFAHAGETYLLKEGTELMKLWKGRDKKKPFAEYFDCYYPGLPYFRVYRNSKHKHLTVQRSPKQGLVMNR